VSRVIIDNTLLNKLHAERKARQGKVESSFSTLPRSRLSKRKICTLADLQVCTQPLVALREFDICICLQSNEKRKRPSKRTTDTHSLVPWNLVGEMASAQQGYDKALIAEVLAPTLNEDEEADRDDEDFVPSIKLDILKSDRRMRSQGRDIPTCEDLWSCRKCMKINSLAQSVCKTRLCDGKRDDGTKISA
jgi:hypothetical protein